MLENAIAKLKNAELDLSRVRDEVAGHGVEQEINNIITDIENARFEVEEHNCREEI